MLGISLVWDKAENNQSTCIKLTFNMLTLDEVINDKQYFPSWFIYIVECM